MTSAAFTLEICASEGAGASAEVTVNGEVDVTNVEEFIEAVLDVPGPRPVILQISPIKYLDSAAFAALDRLLEQNAILLVLAPNSFMYRVAELMCLPIHHDVETARRVLRENAS
jgi:anti-sigma B factor antagonist